MRLGIEARWLTRGPESGRTMVTGIVDALVQSVLPSQDELVLFVDGRDASHLARRFAPHGNVSVRGIWFANRLLAISAVLGPVADRAEVDVLLTHTFAPPRCRAAKVLYVYDVLFESHPQFFTTLERLYFRGVRWSCRRADAVIALSHFTKSQLSFYEYFPANKITVVHPGASNPLLMDPSSRQRSSIDKPYLLYVGRLNDRKNIGTILTAYTQVSPHIDADLVLAGRADGRFNDPSRVVPAHMRSRVHFLGYVGDDKLGALYRDALAVVYVPFAEGFGLPILEAMAYEVPVIASEGSGVAEAIGGAGLQVDPYSIEDLAGAMKVIAKDPARARELALKGRQRATLFSWEKAAQQVLDVCRMTAGATNKLLTSDQPTVSR